MRKGVAWRRTWLAIGVGVCGYGLLTGGGLAGILLGWELEKFHTVDPGPGPEQTV